MTDYKPKEWQYLEELYRQQNVRINELEQENKNLREDCKVVWILNDEIRRVNENLREENKNLKSDVDVYKSQRYAYKKKYLALLRANTELDEENRKLREELEKTNEVSAIDFERVNEILQLRDKIQRLEFDVDAWHQLKLLLEWEIKRLLWLQICWKTVAERIEDDKKVARE